jgi:hypothetical protein
MTASSFSGCSMSRCGRHCVLIESVLVWQTTPTLQRIFTMFGLSGATCRPSELSFKYLPETLYVQASKYMHDSNQLD